MEAQQSNQMSETNILEVKVFTDTDDSIKYIIIGPNGSLIVKKEIAATILGSDKAEWIADTYHLLATTSNVNIEYTDEDDSLELYDEPEENDD